MSACTALREGVSCSQERAVVQEHSRTNKIPLLIHTVNVSALLLGGVLLLLTAVTSTYQLIILVPVVGLLAVYWRLRRHPSVVAWYFGMAIALLAWIFFCEQIVTFDKVFGTRISRHLRLGVRLQTYALRTLSMEDTGEQKELETCCDDPLTWHYRPGSRYRATFDCPTCSAPYEVTVDETGYLNQPLGLMQRHQQIDLFLAGDSGLQGLGVPSVVEQLRGQLPVRLWNLSIQAYGPRQKVNALLTYALPKSPQWLVIDHVGNDGPEAIRDDVCESRGDFRCRYNRPEVERRVAQHPTYSTIFDVRTGGGWARLADYATENLTLATTRYLLNAMKQRLAALVNAAPHRDAAREFYNLRFPPPVAGPPVPVRQGQWLAYFQAGMAATQQQYKRLWVALEGMKHKPTVILLYIPSPYEVYRDMEAEPDQRADQMSALQREALSAFAHTHGWQFLDLTEPLREAVQGGAVWLYGRYDTSHWSPQGTAVVADVLAAELLKSLRFRQR